MATRAVALFTLGICLFRSASLAQVASAGGLAARLQAAKYQWVVGSPVRLQLTVTNQSRETIKTSSLEVDPKRGDVSLLVSDDGVHFRLYLGPDWGTEDILRTVTLAPGASEQSTFSVLWNHDLYRKATVQPDFLAFPKAGTYTIKAQVLTGWGTIETNTITIALVAPIGADNAVWEAIKTDSRLTRFIQDPRPDEREAELVAGKLRGLLNASPNSIYSSDINRTLTDYAQRKDSMERMLNESGQPRCK